ncbi:MULTISPECIES: hybrid sensor histidine kinase/response regulator [Burkholderia cepacia complex]|uniref:hybrid sensor histidine kinase/response regulator n=1 Tax=Burkholderia cepacia complex TaxID=87882 RepID=UPI001B9AAA24|nr:hybrid sensor histidine kinase/response regulator [Burkholderia cenocepacia]MBR8321129.1 response regulator [Burkholderia cenocepacia]
MPTKLKTLLAHAAAAGRKPFDPGRVRRQQQALLYGSAATITAFILVCTALVVRLEVHEYLAQVRSTFLQRETRFYASLQAGDKMLSAYGSRVEQIWNRRISVEPTVLRQLDEGRGTLALSNTRGVTQFLVLAEVTPQRPAVSYARYLTMLTDHQDTVTPPIGPTDDDEPHGGYLIGLDGNFLGVLGAPLVARAQSLGLRSGSNLPSLIAALTPTGAQIRKGGGVFMADRRVDPVVGRPVIRFARRLDDANGRPFGWLVVNAGFEIDEIMAPQSSDEDTAVIDARKNIVFGRLRDRAMVEHGLSNAHAPFGEHVVVRRVGLHFVVSDRLPDSRLVMVTTFSWRSVVKATLAGASATLGLAVIAVALLWVAIVMFDRRALRPANRRAIRLIESEALNRTLIRTAPAGLMLLSLANGDTMVRNDAAQRYGDAATAPPLGKRIWQAYRDSAAGGRPPRVVTHELRLELDGADMAYLAAHIVRTRYRGVDVLLCTLTDVTARKQLEDKLREAREAADDANKAKSTFLATMSHEIRTPLNAIVGNLELMERAPLPPEERRRLRTVMSSSDALLRVINDVLDLSKVESNQMVLEAVPFDLRAVLRDVAAIFHPLAAAKHLGLDCTIDPELADGYIGDPIRLRQIVSNLVSNAIKFTERGSVTIDARPTGTAGQAHGVEILVRDTGIGIAPEGLPTLFDVYVQTDASIYRRFGGTGLGLPLCRRLARLMHGDLAVETVPGQGATFIVSVPLSAAPSEARAAFDETEAGAVPLPAPADDEVPLRVLVAEDHPASRALLRDQLDALHCDATLVSNGVEAMRAYFEQPFDVVLTDLGMPELDGFALANFLREQGATVPVIAMTAHATEEDRRRCAQAGAVEVVLKPLSIDALDAVLRRHAGHGATAQPDRRQSVAVTDEMRQKLQAATLRSLPAIDAALVSGDRQAIRLELHSIRGGFALVGDADAAAACAQMERLEKEADMAELRIRWPAFQDEIRHALARLCDTAYPGAGRVS